MYHLGAAHYIQTQLMPHLPEDELSFSGSSGGALVACALCTGISIEELARYVIDCYPECRFNPWRMLPSAESAMEMTLGLLPPSITCCASPFSEDRRRKRLWKMFMSFFATAFCTYFFRIRLRNKYRYLQFFTEFHFFWH